MPKQQHGKGKRKKNYYVQFQKKQRTNTLEPGSQGFLLTCNNDERRCIREAYNMLNEFSETEQNAEKAKAVAEGGNVEDELDEELTSLKSSTSEGRTFQQVYTGIQSCLFIQSKLDPCPILLRILEDIRTKGQQKTLATQKMFPVMATCKAHLDNLRKAMKEVIDHIIQNEELYQPKDDKLEYGVLFRARHNSSIKKDEVVTTVIDMVRSEGVAWQPEPRTPNCAISVDVLSSICCISILPRYDKYKRYNLIELAKTKNEDCVQAKSSTKDENDDNELLKDGREDDKDSTVNASVQKTKTTDIGDETGENVTPS